MLVRVAKPNEPCVFCFEIFSYIFSKENLVAIFFFFSNKEIWAHTCYIFFVEFSMSILLAPHHASIFCSFLSWLCFFNFLRAAFFSSLNSSSFLLNSYIVHNGMKFTIKCLVAYRLPLSFHVLISPLDQESCWFLYAQQAQIAHFWFKGNKALNVLLKVYRDWELQPWEKREETVECRSPSCICFSLFCRRFELKWQLKVLYQAWEVNL